MTVLAWRNGIIAADRRVLYGSTLQAPMCKLVIGRSLNYRFVVGSAGNSESDEQSLALARHALETSSRPDFKGELALLVAADPLPTSLRKAARRLLVLEWDSDGVSSLVSFTGKRLPKYIALGSGIDVALGAMKRGATAVEAVQAAAEHVSTVGDGVNYVDTNQPTAWRIKSKRK